MTATCDTALIREMVLAALAINFLILSMAPEGPTARRIFFAGAGLILAAGFFWLSP